MVGAYTSLPLQKVTVILWEIIQLRLLAKEAKVMGGIVFRFHPIMCRHLPNELEALLAMKQTIALPHLNTPNT